MCVSVCMGGGGGGGVNKRIFMLSMYFNSEISVQPMF